MEVKPMLPVRHIVLVATLGALLAALEVQPVVAAFGITSTAGATESLAPLPSVYPGASEATLPVIFPEILGAVVRNPNGLPVDHDGSAVVAAPTISGNVVNPALISATLPQGTSFNSYLFHFDPVGSPFFAFYVSTITFDQPIIGVQLFSNGFALQKPAGNPYIGTLEAGDSEVLLDGGPIGVPPILRPTYYPGGVAFRGLEEDAFILAISGTTVMIAGSANGTEIDQVRILTAGPLETAVPEPMTAITWSIISVIGCSGAFVWRRQKNG
jgi:hypothetical protein